MRTPSKSERIINCTFSVLFLTCLFRTLFSDLLKKIVSVCFKQVFIDGKTCENCFFVLYSWSLKYINTRVVGIWGGVGKSWRQTADVLLSQIPKYFEKLWLHIKGEDFFFYFYQKTCSFSQVLRVYLIKSTLYITQFLVC